MSEEIKTIDSKIMYKNRWMTVREDAILRDDGFQGIYGVVEKTDFAVIIPIEDDCVYMVEQYRYPVKKRYLEFPQGSWENTEITPLDLARAELREETGISAEEMIMIGHLYCAYGYSNQGYTVFIAKKLCVGEPELDKEETGLITKKVKISDFIEMIKQNTIKDAATVAAYGLLSVLKIKEFV